MIPITVSVGRTADLLTPGAYGADAVLRVYRADTVDGEYTPVDAVTLQTGRSEYVVWDALGGPTTWYRSRIEAADGSKPSDYSRAFQAGQTSTYADVEDLEALLPPSTRERDRAHLEDLLVRATAYVTAKGERDFRRPVGDVDETFLLSLAGATRTVRLPSGMGAVASVEYATATGGSFTTLDPSAYVLAESRSGSGYFDRLTLTDVAPISSFVPGQSVVRVVARRGEVPEIIRAGTLALARMMYATEATPNGAPKAQPILAGALPLETEAAISWAQGLTARSARTGRSVRSVRLSSAAARPFPW